MVGKEQFEGGLLEILETAIDPYIVHLRLKKSEGRGLQPMSGSKGSISWSDFSDTTDWLHCRVDS